jgi:hypothetical protein
MGELTREPYIDPKIKVELLKIRDRVLNKDRDYVAVYDGEEGVGKSVLAMQHAALLDPNFNIENVVFTSEQFIKKIKDPNTKKGTCIILDEAFNAANSRAALTEVNRSMIALATEMRQKNLFVILVLPTFFDLDRYFALWRCRALFHVYFTPEEDRHYVTFDKVSKKLLYLSGKKQYNYNYPKAPFSPAKFFNQYVIDEIAYREKKAEAFKKRTVGSRAKNWIEQRNACVVELHRKYEYNFQLIDQLFRTRNIPSISSRAYDYIIAEVKELNDTDMEGV